MLWEFKIKIFKDFSMRMEGWFKKGIDYVFIEGRVSILEFSFFFVLFSI